MKLSKMGLAAIAALVLLSPAAAFAQKAPKIDEKNHKRGQAEAPAIVAATGSGCTVADALLVGEVDDPKAKTRTSFYEVACQGSMGRVVQKIASTDKKAPAPIADKLSTFDCLSTSVPQGGKPNSLMCVLPANANAMTGLVPFVAKAGVNCEITNARAIGQTATNAYFEVACSNKRGYILATTATLDPSKEVGPSSCLLYEDGAAISCILSKRDDQLTVANVLAASADPMCQVKDRRYLLSTVAGDEYYEVACASGTGFMVVSDPKGAFKSKIDCANADQISGGCTLTDIKTAKTADNALYTKLAKASGFNCDVSGYRTLGSDANGESVELQCGNRPDGALGVMPKTGNGRFYNCAAAQTTGYRCNLTKPEAANMLLTAAVKKARPTSTCQVSESHFIGASADAGFVEVACADKEPGYVLRYPKTSDQATDALYCTQSKTLIGIGCGLPTNIVKG